MVVSRVKKGGIPMNLRAIIRILAMIVLMATLPTSDAAQDKPKSSIIEFSFTVQGGKKIAAFVFPADKFGKDRKMVVFSPHIDKTDGNFYNASIQALHQIYGKKRGLFQLKDAKSEHDPAVGGNAVYWNVVNPNQRFYSFPIKDSNTGRIASIVVWLK